jgi:toxin ParE1/3/4
MKRLGYSILAREDLAEIASYKLLTTIRARCQMLCTFPQAGKRRSDLPLPGLWGYPVKPYVIFYQIQPETLLLVRVLHGKRDIEAVFKQ